MTDLTEAEIREAVELAEGFDTEFGASFFILGLGYLRINAGKDERRLFFDALAMQLARQARDKRDEWWHDHKSEWVILHRFNVSMNAGDSVGAIRAILKAKVLR